MKTEEPVEREPNAAVEPIPWIVRTADGVELAARRFEPPAGCPLRGAVLIVPAMGVAQEYYARFAAWLAGEGFVVATFDYRGTGRSRPAAMRNSLRGFEATVFDWARLDCGALLRGLQGLRDEGEAAQSLPIYWIGHSLGGQILPFVPGHERSRRC